MHERSVRNLNKMGDSTRPKALVTRAQEMAPTKQRAVYLSETGLTFGLVDVPKPGPGQILVKIIAAAQNPVDCQF